MGCVLFLGPVATLLIVASPPGGQTAGQPSPGRMGRTQAMILGVGVIIAIALVAGLIAAGGR